MNNSLEKAQKTLSNFLKKHPELSEYQKEIDRRLSKAPTFENRMEILQIMMAERLLVLKQKVEELKEVTKKAIEEAKNKQK